MTFGVSLIEASYFYYIRKADSLRKRSEFIVLILVTFVFSYAISIGTTFNGILTPDFHNLTLGLTGVVVGGWLFVHWRKGWVWHRTPLDTVFILWVAAFGLSLAVNIESWRRIAIGLWYVSTYMGVWYLLCDVIGNGGVKRDILVDALMICGVVVLIFGYYQTRDWFTNTLPLITAGLIPVSLPRPVSTLGNPNALANFLVVLVPFALARFVAARQVVARVAMGGYAALALLLIFLTYSRGSWIGVGAGIAIWFVLVLAQHNMMSASAMIGWWRARGIGTKVVTAAATALILLSIVAAIVLFLRSFQESGRSTGMRTGIWNDALTVFSEKPLTGSGLFTFGRELSRLYSTPPNTPHSHAHDAVLHIAAELGLMGLVALGATLVAMFVFARRNWRDMDDRQRGTLAGAVGAVVAFGVHELTDIPATTPAVTLAGLLALAIMMMPVKPIALSSTWRRVGHPFAMAGLWVVLLITGLWSSQIYSAYGNILLYAIRSNDFRGAATQMQSVIEADPALVLYDKEQGLLWGLAANEGDREAAREGIAVYERLVVREPFYAVVWSNLASLYWQVGEQEKGVEAMRRAVELAPLSWQLAVNLGNYETALDHTVNAQAAYEQALELYPDISLITDLKAAVLRQSVLSVDNELSIPAQVVTLLDHGEVEQAQEVWAQNPQPKWAGSYIIDALLALAEDNRESAELVLAEAERVIVSKTDRAWVLLGWARLAAYDGETATMTEQLQAAQENLKKGVFEGDFVDGLSIAYAQFLRLGFPRQFLPQVYYPVDDPVLLHLLAGTQE
jgi:putative inorganic carbon (hco3(-)) transporter